MPGSSGTAEARVIRLHASLATVAASRPEPRITIVRAGALGDTILLLPTLQLLRDRMPGAHLTLVGSGWAEALRPLLPFPLETASIDDPGLATLFGPAPTAGYPAAGCPVRGRVGAGIFSSADAVVLYTASPTADFAGNVTACCRGPVLVRSVSPPCATHAAVHYAQAVVQGPLSLQDLLLSVLRPPADLAAWARQWMAERIGSGRRPVALHPGSGGRHKQWSPAGFAALAARLAHPIVLLEGPADAPACRQVAARMPRGLMVVGAAGLSLHRVAALLMSCRLCVGNDSGISHLAAALGVPTVTVVGPTDPSIWGPLGPRVSVVRPDDGAAWPTVDAVLEAAQRLTLSRRDAETLGSDLCDSAALRE